MKTAQQKIKELKQRVALGVKISRVLLVITTVSLITNSILATQLHSVTAKQLESIPTIISTGTMEKVGDNTFTIIPDEDLSSYDLPPVPSHLK